MEALARCADETRNEVVARLTARAALGNRRGLCIYGLLGHRNGYVPVKMLLMICLMLLVTTCQYDRLTDSSKYESRLAKTFAIQSVDVMA
jgi:hypothetical protein